MQSLLLSLLLVTAAAETAEEQRVYVLGSSINLRKEPSKEAEVVEKLQIGTECRVTEKLEGEWLKVCCGGKAGYAAASLLGPERPSIEKLAAEARDTSLKLAQREESALRAATLAPEDTELQKLLGDLFFERNLELVVGNKKPTTRRTFSYQCFNQTELSCLADAALVGVGDVKVRVEAKNDLFVVAIGNAERVYVYRGRYKVDKVHILRGQVFEHADFVPTPVMERALFFGIRAHAADRGDHALGQFFLDEDSHAILDALPREWGVLEPTSLKGFFKMHWNDCLKRPFLLTFEPDLHGRWLLFVERVIEPGINTSTSVRWISAVSKRGNEIELTLEEDKARTTREILKLPEGKGDVMYLGDKPYSFKLNRYSEIHHKCVQGGP